MAHYKIFQVSREPLDDEDYINASDLQDNMAMEGQYKEFADYIDDDLDGEDVLDALELAESLLKEIFYVEGRILTFKGADDFIKEWKDKMRRQLDDLTPKDSLSFWELHKMTTQTHYRTWHRFMWTEVNDGVPSEDYPDEFGDFVLTCYKNLEVGDKLYIGGIVGFHF